MAGSRREIAAHEDDGGPGFARAQAAAVSIKRAAALGVNRLQGREARHDKCGQMIHAHDEHGIRGAALDQFRTLHQRDEAGDAGDGNGLHRAARAVFGGEISGEQVGLQMAAGGVGAGAAIGQAFQGFDVRLGRGEDEADGGRRGMPDVGATCGVSTSNSDASPLTEIRNGFAQARCWRGDGRDCRCWNRLGRAPTMLDWKRGLVNRSSARRPLALFCSAARSERHAAAHGGNHAATRDGHIGFTHTTTILPWRSVRSAHEIVPAISSIGPRRFTSRTSMVRSWSSGGRAWILKLETAANMPLLAAPVVPLAPASDGPGRRRRFGPHTRPAPSRARRRSPRRNDRR